MLHVLAYNTARELGFEAASRRNDTVRARKLGVALTDADEAARREADAREEAAARAFVETVPTTPRGARAMIEHYVKHSGEFESAGLALDLLSALLKSPVLAA